jgi:hypothetical protein
MSNRAALNQMNVGIGRLLSGRLCFKNLNVLKKENVIPKSIE